MDRLHGYMPYGLLGIMVLEEENLSSTSRGLLQLQDFRTVF